jgi:hypothetical protein
MPRYIYAFIVKALSLRDGGWVRMGCYWQTEEDGWQFYYQFFTLLVPLDLTYIKVINMDTPHPLPTPSVVVALASTLMRDSLIPEHHEIPSYVIAGELYEG